MYILKNKNIGKETKKEVLLALGHSPDFVEAREAQEGWGGVWLVEQEGVFIRSLTRLCRLAGVE